MGGQLPRPLLDDGKGAPGSASSAGEGINDSIVDEWTMVAWMFIRLAK